MACACEERVRGGEARGAMCHAQTSTRRQHAHAMLQPAHAPAHARHPQNPHPHPAIAPSHSGNVLGGMRKPLLWAAPLLLALAAACAPAPWVTRTAPVMGSPLEVTLPGEHAEAVEEVCVETVESGFMTKDLAILVGPEQGWMTTQRFLAKLDENLAKKLG